MVSAPEVLLPNRSKPVEKTPSLIQPGRDAFSHERALQENMATTLTDLYGVKIESSSVVPPQSQTVGSTGSESRDGGSTGVENLMQNSDQEMDFEDIKNGWTGKPRTEPSKNFLSHLIQRLRKQHPEKEVVSE